MFLQTLVPHVPAQNEAVKRHLSRFEHLIPSKDSPPVFTPAIWGAGIEALQVEELVERDEDPVDVLPDVIPATRIVMTPPESHLESWCLPNERILVRSEYYETARAVLSANEGRVDAFVVAGQSGVGKTFFLYWLLMYRLAVGLPTVLQTRREHAILFHEGGVSVIDDLKNPEAYGALKFPRGSHHKRIWALIDTGPLLPEPADIFMHPGTFFVVNATSRFNLREWFGVVHFNRFFMEPWAFSEIIQARTLFEDKQQYTEQYLWDLYNKFGSSPRDFHMYTSNPAAYEDLVIDQIQTIEPDDLRYIPYNPKSTHCRVFTVWPSPTSRYMYENRIVSRFIFELLWDRLLQYRISDMRYLYYEFRASATMAASAVWIFEHRIHQLLRSQATIRLVPIIRHKPGPNDYIYKGYQWENPIDLWLPGSAERPLVEGGRFRRNRYCRLDSPGANSFLLVYPPDGSPPILLIFVVTCSTEIHYVSEDILRKIDSCSLPPDVRRYHVVVTPKGARPKIKFPEAYSGKKGSTRQSDKGLRVFNYPVGDNVLFPDLDDVY